MDQSLSCSAVLLETLQHRHQTPVYSKQNHRTNPVINHFPENYNPFYQQKTVPRKRKFSDAVRNRKKTLIIGTSMIKGKRIKKLIVSNTTRLPNSNRFLEQH